MRCSLIINDILDYSKIEAGKIVLDPLPFHLPSLVGDTVKAMALAAHKKGLELAFQLDPSHSVRTSGRLWPLAPGACEPRRQCHQVHIARAKSWSASACRTATNTAPYSTSP